MQPPVAVVKASAGSGKTHRLTQDYLQLLLKGDPQRYKHILAVTFTNKATDEMKSRVIEELYKRSREDDDQAPFAAERLRRILHDYSCFSVSTIDKFFQTVMRSFAREIGQHASYRVELDDEAVFAQVVDLMLASMDEPEGAALLNWLREYSFDRVEQGMNWNITAPLRDMARHFLDESFLLKMRSVSSIIDDKTRVEAFRGKLGGLIGGFEKEARRIAAGALALIQAHGRGPADFKWKKSGPMMIFHKWASGQFAAPNAARLRIAFDDFPDREGLSRWVEAAITHYERGWRDYNSALTIRENLHLMGIYADVLHHLQAYLQENNVVLLRQSTDLLSRIIADDDTPFIYEKIGNRYDHLMLDEAQDTSLLQWRNFKPLFANSAAQGSRSLVVGDIKQSIYRWRGSDWRLLSEYLDRDLGSEAIENETLSENWRSGQALVDFNNALFTQAGATLASEPGLEDVGTAIGHIYADAEQQIPQAHKPDPEGYVRLSFLPSDETASWRETALDRMVEDIAALRAEGYDYKEITILVRKNREGAEVAAHLMDKGISVLTEDSLQIGASPCIGRLMALLAHQVNPDDPVSRLLVEEMGIDALDGERGSLYETCERLLDLPQLAHGEADLPFIHAFLDSVLAWQEKYGSSLRGFVQWWDESGHKKAICAPDGQNAVRVMTIHKAKGLSLDAVILPLVDDPFLPPAQLQPTIWCETSGPFAELGLIPLKASSKLLDTCFAADYRQERIYEFIDVTNTWYVAFTRARSRMIIYAPQPTSSGRLQRISDLLFRIFSAQLDKDLCFQAGSRPPFIRKEDSRKLEDDPQPSFSRVAMSADRLKLRLHGDDYFAQEESARQQGIEKHRDMATVIEDEELEALSGHRHWFDGTYKVMNEASIVDTNGEIKRPDRVLISRDNTRVIIIDYKFGQPLTSHDQQVRTYVRLMQQMGYPAVEGWLWYITASEVVRVQPR